MKTHKGAKRRFKITGTGKILRAAGNKRHLKYGKNKRTLHNDNKTREITGAFRKKVRSILPTSF
ncbi:MAG: large ribosomal subunit protein bL35 [Dehalococcoidia bacterium]